MNDFEKQLFISGIDGDVCPIRRYHIDSSADEIRRFEKAREEIKEDAEQLFADTAETSGEAAAERLSVCIALLDDERLLESVYNIISDQMINAETAAAQTAEIFSAQTEHLHGDMPAAHPDELKTVYEAVIRKLLGLI